MFWNIIFKALQKIRHANVIKLREVIREDNNLYMIFEVNFHLKLKNNMLTNMNLSFSIWTKICMN